MTGSGVGPDQVPQAGGDHTGPIETTGSLGVM